MWWASYPARIVRRCRGPKISIGSVTSVRAVSTNLSAQAFARGLGGGMFTASMPASARTGSNGAGSCPARSRARNRKACGAITQIHQKVAGLLHCPQPVRVRSDPEDVHIAAAGLGDEQAVPALEGNRAVHMEEVRWRASSMPGWAGTAARPRRCAVSAPGGSSGP